MKILDETGMVTNPNDPLRLLWYGLCTYWTDNWDRLDSNPIPCCPLCGSPGFQISAEQWFDGADRFESEGNPGYIEFLKGTKEICHGRKVGFMDLWKKHNQSYS